jgi:anti-sigma factor RsiW
MADQHVHSRAEDPACIEVVEMMTDYLEGALPAAEVLRLERHLAMCPGCTEYLEQLSAIAGSLGGVTEQSFPPELRDDLIAEFRRLRNS